MLGLLICATLRIWESPQKATKGKQRKHMYICVMSMSADLSLIGRGSLPLKGSVSGLLKLKNTSLEVYNLRLTCHSFCLSDSVEYFRKYLWNRGVNYAGPGNFLVCPSRLNA